MKRAFTLILAVCLCLFLAAPASAAADSSPFVGDWKFYSQEGEAPMSHEEILAMAEMGLDMTTALITSFRGDGTMTMSVFGEKVDGTWTDSGDGTGVFNIEQFDPDPFMAEIGKYGLPWNERIDEPLPIEK